ncbi:hypothetical protein [Chitinophaga sp. CB10]|uniref:hypothetical protein n=1 Tax=Chitinophaga sp. CB10 TaxID=1891659 RepID=UPI0025C1CCCB|nr:hypothetical protein [Chitinophaga sp. CB10]
MSLEQQEPSIFSEQEFETPIKGKAYPTVTQLLILIPVAIGACILAMIPLSYYLVRNVPNEPENPTAALSMGLAMMVGVMALMILFMVWQKKKHEPDYKYTFNKPIRTDLLSKTALTYILTNLALYLAAEKMHLDSLGFTMQVYYNQLTSIGPGILLLCYGVILPVLSFIIMYDIVCDGLLKNYKAFHVLIAVVVLSFLNFKPGLILVALPTSILSFLIYSRTRAIMYLLLPGVLVPLVMMGITLVMPLGDFLDALAALPGWTGLAAVAIAGLCWFVLINDLRKMEPADKNSI